MCGPRERYGELSFCGDGTSLADSRCRRRGRRGFCGHGWRTLRRGREICGWRGFRPFPSLARFAALQDDAAVFGHTRPAGLDAMVF